jgi:hypothetical protein
MPAVCSSQMHQAQLPPAQGVTAIGLLARSLVMIPLYHSPTQACSTVVPRPLAAVKTLNGVVTSVHNVRRSRRSFQGVSSILRSQLCT